jgi:oxygen-independent coproporphyrinogen-3 oxidase
MGVWACGSHPQTPKLPYPHTLWPMQSASAYIHIPFCVRKCLYCDFNSYPGKEELFEEYVQALKAEIRLAAARFPEARVPTIYFGGGTPNVLSADQLTSVLDQITQSFDVLSDAEITIESNPGLPIVRNGFNRLSLGVQSFEDNELRALGRIHTAGEAMKAYRDAEFSNISVDLMYGIPGQTLGSWRETLDKALDLGPEHISLYSLTIEEGTPYWDMCRSGRLELPGDDIEADMYELAIEKLTSAGYEHYEISNFARPGFECRHNITYWENRPYFGFGAGATSYLAHSSVITHQDCVRSTNVRSVEAYIAGEPPESGECLTGKAAMGETMFLSLRMLRGVDVNAFRQRYGVTPQEAFPHEIPDLVERSLIEMTPDAIRLTRRGLFLANDVFTEFVS